MVADRLSSPRTSGPPSTPSFSSRSGAKTPGSFFILFRSGILHGNVFLLWPLPVETDEILDVE